MKLILSGASRAPIKRSELYRLGRLASEAVLEAQSGQPPGLRPDWFVVVAVVMQDGAPRPTEAGLPDVRLFVTRAGNQWVEDLPDRRGRAPYSQG
jgi:hypothetical protein